MRVTELLEDDDCFYISCELLEGGELFDRIGQVQQFNEVQAAQIINQVLLAINYMHSKNITHRDLKPENILLEDTYEYDKIKLIDFGEAAHFVKGVPQTDVVGTPYYIAPEVVNR